MRSLHSHAKLLWCPTIELLAIWWIHMVRYKISSFSLMKFFMLNWGTSDPFYHIISTDQATMSTNFQIQRICLLGWDLAHKLTTKCISCHSHRDAYSYHTSPKMHSILYASSRKSLYCAFSWHARRMLDHFLFNL